VIDPSFPWEDAGWTGLPLERQIIYELHVGTFSPQGTLDAVIPFLDPLKDLGITSLELMPVAQFPGERNWGYDGAYPFAVQNSYGGPGALKRLVNACHVRGLSVILDVVYNHLGPEGDYLGDFGPYFGDIYQTPWGMAINFDGPESDEVRRFFVENALYWVGECRVDALRLDAVHGIRDFSAKPFLGELAEVIGEFSERHRRKIHLIAESDLNDTRILRPPERGGYGLDAQWNDDFQHALHALLTGERNGYYQDFGKVDHFKRALSEGFVYSGQYSAFRRRRHGNSSGDLAASKFVVFSQNHDQVGNRMLGERLGGLISFEGLKLAASAVMFSPYIPLLFMGEEYGERAPFLYFVSHSDPSLIEAVRNGRRAEFSGFAWRGVPPDPQDESTFLRCRLKRSGFEAGDGRVLQAYYRELIRLRRALPALAHLSKDHLDVWSFEEEKALALRRWKEQSEAVVAFNFRDRESPITLPLEGGIWRKRLDSAEKAWSGRGSAVPSTIEPQGSFQLPLAPESCVLLERESQPGG
jgi:maltooligosyltrehalose trehalohydrolase